jgi:hypothetical protein
MKQHIFGSAFSLARIILSARVLVTAGFLFGTLAGRAASIDPSSGPTNTPLDSWSFNDSTYWTSDNGYDPVSFTNLSISPIGNFRSLVLDTNVPAWLQYNVFESDGTTNLTVDNGTVMFWFAPNWSGTNQGGTGPGEYGRLFEVGSYTADSSYGWWSIFVDDVGNNLYFSAQTNDLSSTFTHYISVPISWTNTCFHFITLTYCATNTAMYLDGILATNGPGVTVFPGLDVLTNGFFIGSDSNGVFQAHGFFNTVQTFDYPLNTNDIWQIYQAQYSEYILNPYNMGMPMARISSAPSSPSVTVTPNVITGQGNLTLINLADDYIYGTNAYQVWITNVTSTVASDGTVSVTFTIEGGQNGYYYDVFVGTSITSPFGNGNWSWQGQAQRRQQCSLSSLPQGTVFIILGTPLDTDGDGLTDAYEKLVSHTDPNNPYSNLDGIIDGWEILLGLNPTANNFTSPSARANYGYTPADWLNTVSGVKSGAVTTDNEGNALSVSQ